MVPMAGCARGSAQVAAHGHGFVVDALAVVRKLRGPDAIRLHVIRVRMAVTAGGGNVQRIDARPDVARWQNVMNSMAVRAHRNLGVSSEHFSP